MKKSTPPFICHVFVCTHDRQGARKSCADGANVETRTALKQAIKARGLKGQARVSATGCLGLCEQGPNVIVYPQGLLFSDVSASDVGPILDAVVKIVETS